MALSIQYFFQLGHDNWDNGIIAFTYGTDVDGTSDHDLNNNNAPTPNLPGSGGSSTIPEPSVIALMSLVLAGISFIRRKKNFI